MVPFNVPLAPRCREKPVAIRPQQKKNTRLGRYRNSTCAAACIQANQHRVMPIKAPSQAVVPTANQSRAPRENARVESTWLPAGLRRACHKHHATCNIVWFVWLAGTVVHGLAVKRSCQVPPHYCTQLAVEHGDIRWLRCYMHTW